ncbi:MAG TPA: efflux RND transporter periplasmic adaptor subunit [Terriglobales bacterium]|nr:efflux RND transporter periplasmic adaptor subunit [Terriglobales bacterium]
MKRGRALVIFSSSLLFVAGCSSTKPAMSVASAATPAGPSMTSDTRSEQPMEISAPIIVENQVDVVAQREGVVAAINVEAGNAVHKGRLLATIDDRQLTAERDAAAAKVKAIAADGKNWEAAQKMAELDLSRDEEMYKANLLTQKQLDHSRTKLVGTKYEVEREKENLVNAESTLRALELELEKTKIVAPFAGLVARRYVRAGQHVANNDKLFWVTATEPLVLRFNVPELYAQKFKAGQELTVTTSSSNTRYRAAVTMVSPVIDPGSGTFDVQAKLLAPTTGLVPGMTATVVLKNAK